MRKNKEKKACLLGINVSLTISFLCRLHMSVNLFSVLEVYENHYFISATKWVCVCMCVSMRAVYLVLPFISAYVCVCLYAYCLLSIFKPFISVCVCVCVCVCARGCVCDRERDRFNEFSIVNVFYCQPCISHWPTRGLQPCSWRANVLQISAPTPIKHTWTS